MDIKSIKGIAVVSIGDGARLGEVSDALFDLDDRRVRALVVGQGGLFGGKERILDFDDVKSVGSDAVMIEARDQMVADRDDPRYRTYPDIGRLASMRVVSEAGELIGSLATVRVNPIDGIFTDIEVSHHGLLGPFRSHLIVPASTVIRFGEDVVVVPGQYVEGAQPDAGAPPRENPPGEVQAPPPSDG